MSTAAAWASGLLFLAFLIRAFPGWIRCLSQPEPGTAEIPPVAKKEYLRVLAVLSCALILRVALVSAVRLLAGKNQNLQGTFLLYGGLDSRHYFDIARWGYTRLNEAGEALDLVFFPGYPLLTGLLMMVIPSEPLCGYLAAWLPFLAGGTALYSLFRMDADEKRAMRRLVLFCLFPAAVFFAYPMSESLFLLAATGSLWAARKQRWGMAGAMGFLAAFTRSVGVLIVVPLAAELLCTEAGKLRTRNAWSRIFRKGAPLMLIPAGTILYLYINYTVTGDPLIFLQYQRSNWHQSLGWFFRTAATQMDYAVRTWTEEPVKFWGLWMPNLLTGYVSLIWMTVSAKKMRPAYTAWYAIYFCVCYGSSWLLSGPRYMTVFFPLAIAADEQPVPKGVLMVLCAAASIGYAVCFAMRWGVW